jgi:hypothetical protein
MADCARILRATEGGSKLEFVTPKALSNLAQGSTLGQMLFVHHYAESVE